jgi:8-oxo-dGTP diphosphatase
MPFTYKYPRPALTVDIAVFRKTGGNTFILLIKRKNSPFENCWAIPGGFVGMDELLADAAARELFEETGLQNLKLDQFYAFDAIDRDPRHRTISVVFVGFLQDDQIAKAGDDAAETAWFQLDQLPSLAFDHEDIIRKIKEK